MKRNITITSIFILLVANLFANPDSVITFLPHWTVGEEKEFEISSKQVILKTDAPRQEVKMKTSQLIEVVEKNDQNYLLEWKATGRFINPFAIDPVLAEVMDTINKAYEPLKINFLVNFNGEPEEIINTEEVQDFYITTLSELESVLIEKGRSVSEAKKIIKDQLDLIMDKEKIQKILFASIQTFFSFYNRPFELEPAPQRYSRQLPLMNRELPITVNTVTQKPGSDTFIIRAESTINDDEIMNTILSPDVNQYFHQLETIPLDKKNEKNYAELNQYIINPESGWLKEAKFHTALLIDGTYIEQLLVLSVK